MPSLPKLPRPKAKKPCKCGCGEYPRGYNSRYLPGHDLREAYKLRTEDRPKGKNA